MPIAVKCKKCNSPWEVNEKLAGKRIKCRKCSATYTVPARAKRKGQRQKVRKTAPAGNVSNSDDELYFGSLQELESEGQALGTGKLIECSECGDVYGGKSDECVHCGAPNLKKETRLRARKQKKEKKNGRNESGVFNALAETLSEYQILVSLLGFTICFMLVAWAVSVYGLSTMKVDRGTRQQVKFRGKTTGFWLDLEREGKAHMSESLWDSQDQRWMSLDNVIELDFAALPELFKALTDTRTNWLAETVMGKPPTRRTIEPSWGPVTETKGPGGPLLEDLEPGFKHTDPLVHKWAAKMAAYYEGKKEDVLPSLEEIANSGNAEASTAAGEAIEQLYSKEKDAAAKSTP